MRNYERNKDCCDMVFIWCALFGCALFNKTSKTTATDSWLSKKQLESSQLVLKNADKKTQVFTYWNDSGFYQYQYVKEQIDQAKIGKVQLEENQQASRSLRQRKRSL